MLVGVVGLLRSGNADTTYFAGPWTKAGLGFVSIPALIRSCLSITAGM